MNREAIMEERKARQNKRQTLKRAGLTTAQADLVVIVAGAQEPMTMGAVAEAMGLAFATLTGVVDKAEAKGYIRRERGKHDRRQVFLVPTDEGIQLAATLSPAA